MNNTKLNLCIRKKFNIITDKEGQFRAEITSLKASMAYHRTNLEVAINNATSRGAVGASIGALSNTASKMSAKRELVRAAEERKEARFLHILLADDSQFEINHVEFWADGFAASLNKQV